jgi:hypothetical protein
MRTAIRTPASTSATITTTTAFETPPGNGTRAPPGTPGIGMAARVTI